MTLPGKWESLHPRSRRVVPQLAALVASQRCGCERADRACPNRKQRLGYNVCGGRSPALQSVQLKKKCGGGGCYGRPMVVACCAFGSGTMRDASSVPGQNAHRLRDYLWIRTGFGKTADQATLCVLTVHNAVRGPQVGDEQGLPHQWKCPPIDGTEPTPDAMPGVECSRCNAAPSFRVAKHFKK